MRPSESLRLHETDVRRVVEKHGAANPRVFGSVATGQDTEESDLDLLVDPIAGRTTLMSLVRIKREIESLLGVPTDVLTPLALRERIRDTVLRQAKPL